MLIITLPQSESVKQTAQYFYMKYQTVAKVVGADTTVCFTDKDQFIEMLIFVSILTTYIVESFKEAARAVSKIA